MLSIDERVELVAAEAYRLLPPNKDQAWVTRVCIDDLGAKHGTYDPDSGAITLSERIFWGRNEAELQYIDVHGEYPAKEEPYCSRALHVCLHEWLHAIGYATGDDRSQEWLALSGWKETWEDRQVTGRYFERRPGWGDQGGSEWRYTKGTWFPREYSSKSPHECYADCGTHIALGWHRHITDANGRAKMGYLLRTCWGEDQTTRLQASVGYWRNRLVV